MTTRLARPRAGFTLIEMLIVIGIIATLAAISVGAFFQVRGSQDKSVTEVTLNKLHSTFDGKYKAVLDDARNSVPKSLEVLLGDKEQARVIWTYAKLKNEFPQTAAEANWDPSLSTVVPLPLKPRAIFSSLVNALNALPADTPLNPGERAAKVSSALMYAALTRTGTSGTMDGSEGLQQQTATENVTVAGTKVAVTYFRDSYDKPIGFIRHATNTEINNPPFAKVNAVSGFPAGTKSTLDPTGRMLALGNPTRMTIVDFLNYGLPNGQPNPSPVVPRVESMLVTLDQSNHVSTFYSAGPNKEFGSEPNATVGTNPISLDLQEEALDNLFSYRLRREGAKGD